MSLSNATTKLSLNGVAMITGGASGLGQATAFAFAELGAKVVIADLNAELGQATADKINSRFPGCSFFVKVNVSDESQVEDAVAQTISKYGRLDYAINSAGIVVGGGNVTKIMDTDLKVYDLIANVDARGVFVCMKHQLRAMVKQDKPSRHRAARGVIVNLASRASLEGVVKFGSYCSAKHAVLGMSRVAALEHAADKIRVVAMCPGLIKTPGHVAAAKEVDDYLLSQLPWGEFGVPEDIVDGITFACSDMGSFMTGNAFEIDGGMAAK